MNKVIVIGLGNPLRQDDGVGVQVLRLIEKEFQNSEHVNSVEVYGGGLTLIEAMMGYSFAIIIDAIELPNIQPGTIIQLQLNEIYSSRNIISTHETSLSSAMDLYAKLGFSLPGEIKIIGVQVLNTGSFSEELSNPVQKSVYPLFQEIVKWIHQWKNLGN